ncbi:MAG: hypothetical protein WC775_06400 [Patescibacteria group bacterium]|jgi:hypothetical protein
MAKIDCPYQEHLNSAKRHCLISLLDYADLLKESKKDVPSAIELVKKRIHNDIAQLGQIASNLISLAKSGGEITPLGEGNGKNSK